MDYQTKQPMNEPNKTATDGKPKLTPDQISELIQLGHFKKYIGDSVYANWDGYTIWLTTENGGAPSNAIGLEPEIFQQVVNYRELLSAELKELMEGE